MEGERERRPRGPSSRVTKLVEQAHANMGREAPGQLLAYLWLALEWLVAGDAAYRMDALAPLSHDALRLLAAQATTEVRLVGGTSPIGEPDDDHRATYMAAVRSSKRRLRAAIEAIVTELGERDWQPPPSEGDNGGGDGPS